MIADVAHFAPFLADAAENAIPSGAVLVAVVAVVCMARCVRAMQAPGHNTKCAVSLLLVGSVFLVVSLMQMPLLQAMLGPRTDADIATNVIAPALLIALVVGILGWLEIARAPQKRREHGRSMVVATFLFSGLLAVGYAADLEGRQEDGAIPSHLKFAGPKVTSIRNEEANYSLSLTAGWQQFDVKKVQPQADVGLYCGGPATYFVVVVEDIRDTDVDLDLMTELSDANLRSNSQKAQPGQWRDLTVNGIPGKRAFMRSTVRGQELIFDQWVGIAAGRGYSLCAWSSPTVMSEKQLANRANEVRSGFQVLDSTRLPVDEAAVVARLGSEAWGYDWPLGSGWQQWHDLGSDWPEAEHGALGTNAALLVVPVRLPSQPVEPLLLARALLGALQVDVQDRCLSSPRRFDAHGVSGFEYDYASKAGSKTYDYRLRVCIGEGRAALVACWGQRGTVPAVRLGETLQGFRWLPAAAPLTEGTGDKGNDGDRRRQAAFHRRLAVLLCEANRHREAEALLAQACRWQPDEAQNFVVRMNCLLAGERYRETIAVVAEAAPFHAGNHAVLSYRAYARARLGERAEAIAEYLELFRAGYRDPTDVEFCASTMIDEGQGDAALRLVADIAADDDTMPMLLLQTRIRSRAGHHDEAINELLRRRTTVPYSAELEATLANVYRHAGRSQDAIDTLDKMMAAGHDGPGTYLAKAAVHADLGHYPQAKATLLAALAAHPGDHEIQENLASVNGMLGQSSTFTVRQPIDPVPLVAAVPVPPDLPVDWSATAAAVVLERSIAIHFEPGRDFRTTTRTRVRVQSQAGVTEYGTLSFPFRPLNESIHVSQLVVRDPDGKEVARGNVDDWYIVDKNDDGMASGEKVLQVPVPGLAPDCVLEVEATRKQKTAPLTFPFTRVLLVSGNPTCRHIVSVSGDVGSLRTIASTGIREVTAPDGRSFLLDGHAGCRAEQYQPDAADWAPNVVLGTADVDWTTVGRQYQTDLARDVPTADLTSVATGQTGTTKDDRTRLLQLARFVQRSIQYQAIEFGVRGRRPNGAGKTLELRYGDCKDHSVLLQSLLRSAGIRAELALVATAAPVVTELPSLDQFDHMIVFCPDIDGGKFVDCTDKHGDPAVGVPPGLAGRRVLVLAESETRLVTVGAYDPANCRIETNSDIRLDATGALHANETVTFHGHYAGFAREFFGGRTREEQHIALQRVLASMTPGLQLEGCDLESVDDCSLPLVLRQRYRVPQAMHAGAGRLPAGWAQYMIALEPTTRRSSPMHVEYPLTVTSVVRVSCDAGIAVDVAADARSRSWRSSFGAGQVRVDGQGREITMSAAVRRDRGMFPPEQFAAAQTFLDEMLQGLRVPLRRGP